MIAIGNEVIYLTHFDWNGVGVYGLSGGLKLVVKALCIGISHL